MNSLPEHKSNRQSKGLNRSTGTARSKSGQNYGRQEPKPVRKASAKYLKNAGLFYVQRYAATEARLKRVLMRKVDKSIRAYGGDRDEFTKIVDELVSEFGRLAYVDDERFALSKARRLFRSGNSRRQISAKLGVDGINRERIASALQALEDDTGDSADTLEWKAAWSFARKKRLGPYREPDIRDDFWKKDVSAMARRGFGSDLSYKVVGADDIPDEFSPLAIGGLS